MNGGAQRLDVERFFEEAFNERIGFFPQKLTLFGRSERQDELNDCSESGEIGYANLARRHLQAVDAFDHARLTPAQRVNCELFRRECKEILGRFDLRFQRYALDQKFGLHAEFPAFMINMHRIADEADALNYIARLRAFATACEQLIGSIALRQDRGVVLPGFLIEQIIGDCDRMRTDLRKPSGGMLAADFLRKIEAASAVPTATRASLLEQCRNALRDQVEPAYRRLSAFMQTQLADAPAQGGLCALPDGEAYYRACLSWETSTDVDPQQIYELGLQEVARLHDEIRRLMPKVGFAGDLHAFFDFTRAHPGFYYPQTPDGRQRYLADLNEVIERARQRLPDLFHVLPNDPLQVRPVEPHREPTAGMAFYHGPAADGSRPGTFYINLYDLQQLPSFTMEALAFHEALPGHHMQFAVANDLEALPSFRRYAHCNAYVEGWALYAERLAHEAGLYADAYGEYGRLTMELKRACRLVVDPALHARGWTRDQAVEYLYENLPASRAQCVAEIDRYLVMPGQATTYTLGLLDILRLRDQSSEALGDRFDQRAFHDALLGFGPLPLDTLADQIADWTQARR
ncbi:DUF885 domain-containing protein [Halopseudomonas nanhaiensis]|uniref:DUF885 domain-containing protein n=1 Tax=Halopseudomonas nanhaiensis TaxID=2830842 RepID=UPI001CBE1ABF|nr:DUF885 domain-containing protein [Halopseudomonas nanhaiensis]UAW98741.1 DUF885 domain-containing protein [Halopseudomonas nanhaiensis]